MDDIYQDSFDLDDIIEDYDEIVYGDYEED